MPLIQWQDLLAACALYLVFEGVLPAVAPARFRAALVALTGFDDRTLRMIGVGSMMAGVLLLVTVRS